MAITSEELSVRATESMKTILKGIYDHRMLTIKQIIILISNNKDSGNAERERRLYTKEVRKLISYGALEKVNHFLDEFYFLTTIGINALRYVYDLPINIYDNTEKIIRRGYYRAGELKLADRFIPHQNALNEFLVGFKEAEHDIGWKYYDEKHLSSFNGIRPDGMLNLLGTDFFIEIDMNTESSSQLYEKWDNYRMFLNSNEFQYNERKIVVLFVIENAVNPTTRINLVKRTIKEKLLDKLNHNFDIYVDTRENLLDLLSKVIAQYDESLVPESDRIFRNLARLGFSVAYGELISNYLGGERYEYYARKIDENNNIITEDGKLQEYLVDHYFDKPMSVLRKINYINRTNAYYSDYFNRKIIYIVVVDNEEDIFKDLQLADLIGANDVYYTTLKRLEDAETFKEAIFQLSESGDIYNF